MTNDPDEQADYEDDGHADEARTARLWRQRSADNDALDKPDANLIVRYTYEFMPKGILTSLIVAMNRLLKSQDFVWRSGMILEDKKAEAEVLETRNPGEIRIRVRGNNKRDLLTKITYELDNIHRTFPGLKWKKLVPCNCEPTCKGSPTPHFFEDFVLKDFLATGDPEIQCLKSRKMVNVRSLLDDIVQTNLIQTKRNMPQSPNDGKETSRIEKQYNFYGEVNKADFIGGDKNMGDQINQTGNFGIGVMKGGTIEKGAKVVGQLNEYGTNIDDLLKLIQVMQQQVNAFPSESQDDLEGELEDIAEELDKPEDQRNIKKIWRRIKALATATVTAFALVAAPTMEMTDFLNNITDLAEKVEPTQVKIIQEIIRPVLPSSN